MSVSYHVKHDTSSAMWQHMVYCSDISIMGYDVLDHHRFYDKY
jgi:hypothetical protein